MWNDNDNNEMRFAEVAVKSRMTAPDRLGSAAEWLIGTLTNSKGSIAICCPAKPCLRTEALFLNRTIQ